MFLPSVLYLHLLPSFTPFSLLPFFIPFPLHFFSLPHLLPSPSFPSLFPFLCSSSPFLICSPPPFFAPFPLFLPPFLSLSFSSSVPPSQYLFSLPVSSILDDYTQHYYIFVGEMTRTVDRCFCLLFLSDISWDKKNTR